jgi:hypothetical protein
MRNESIPADGAGFAFLTKDCTIILFRNNRKEGDENKMKRLTIAIEIKKTSLLEL